MKFLKNLMFAAVALSTITAVGCGGGSGASKGSEAPEVSAIDELKAIPAQLDADVTKLMAPIDGVQSMLDQLANLPAKTGLSSKDLIGQVKAIMDGAPAPSADGLKAEGKAEFDSFLAQVKQFKEDIAATPDRVAGLGKTCVSLTGKVPVLAGQVTLETGKVAVSPFASAEEKAKAKADAESVQAIQAEISGKITATQQKITGIPGMAAGALAKFTAALAGG
jgi:hypothetical protein